ncbi:MAG: hypothetical protein KatS3mg098_173 [Candidatus Parcubacteria bacterium]|nr:MAG: hypothetical protein KatS3mg098_173 [Candidatus Parcubacteria bacterium]
MKKISKILMIGFITFSVTFWSTGGVQAASTASQFTNNGAPTNTVGRGDTNVLLMDITLYDPTDTLVHDGSQPSATGEALLSFPAATKFYDDTATNNNTYDDGEAIINDADNDGFPSAGDSVITSGKAKVKGLNNHNVCFDGADAEYDGTEVIWYDADNGGCTSAAFTTGVDVILVGSATPSGAGGGEFAAGGEQEIGFLDEDNNGSYTCSRAGTCEPLVYSGVNASNITDGINLPTTTAFFDSSAEATDGIKTTGVGWDETGGAEDLNAFPAGNKFRDNDNNSAYNDGEDIYFEQDPNANSVINQGSLGLITLIRNLGTGKNYDISNWHIYKESGATPGFQANQDLPLDLFITDFDSNLNYWTLIPNPLTSDTTFTASQRRIYITADISSGADNGHTFQLKIDVNGFDMDEIDTTGDGPSDAPIINSGIITISVPSIGPADSTPPAAPSQVKAQGTGKSGEIKLTWKNPTDSDFSGVRIFRSLSEGKAAINGEIIVLSTKEESFTDTGLTDGKTYYYVLKAMDGAGNMSVSQEVSAIAGSLPQETQPSTPSQPQEETPIQTSPETQPTQPTQEGSTSLPSLEELLTISLPYPNPSAAEEIKADIEYLQKKLLDLQKAVAQAKGETLPPLAKVYVFNTDFGKGLRNDIVRNLQTILVYEGLLDPQYVTGYFGNITFEAVKKFQAKYGIPQTGFVGPLTRAQLNKLYGGE